MEAVYVVQGQATEFRFLLSNCCFFLSNWQ